MFTANLTFFEFNIFPNDANGEKHVDICSIPVWGFMAILVALDIYHKNNNEDTLSYNDKESLKN